MIGKIAWLSLLGWLALGGATGSEEPEVPLPETSAEQRQRGARSIWPFTGSNSESSSEAPPEQALPNFFLNGETALPKELDLTKYPVWKIHKYQGLDLRPIKLQPQVVYRPEAETSAFDSSSAFNSGGGAYTSAHQDGYKDFTIAKGVRGGAVEQAGPYAQEEPAGPYPPPIETRYPEETSYQTGEYQSSSDGSNDENEQQQYVVYAAEPDYASPRQPFATYGPPEPQEPSVPHAVYGPPEIAETGVPQTSYGVPQTIYGAPPEAPQREAPQTSYAVPELRQSKAPRTFFAAPQPSYAIPEVQQAEAPYASNAAPLSGLQGGAAAPFRQPPAAGNADLSFLDNLGGLAPFLPEPQGTTEFTAGGGGSGGGFLQNLLSRFRGGSSTTTTTTTTTEAPLTEDVPTTEQPAAAGSGGFFASLFGQRQQTETEAGTASTASGSFLSSLFNRKKPEPEPELPPPMAFPITYYLPETKGSYVAVKVPPSAGAASLPSFGSHVSNIAIEEAPAVVFAPQENPSVPPAVYHTAYLRPQGIIQERHRGGDQQIQAVAEHPIASAGQKLRLPFNGAPERFKVDATAGQHRQKDAQNFAQQSSAQAFQSSAAAAAEVHQPTRVPVRQEAILAVEGVEDTAGSKNVGHAFYGARPSGAYEIHIGTKGDRQFGQKEQQIKADRGGQTVGQTFNAQPPLIARGKPGFAFSAHSDRQSNRHEEKSNQASQTVALNYNAPDVRQPAAVGGQSSYAFSAQSNRQSSQNEQKSNHASQAVALNYNVPDARQPATVGAQSSFSFNEFSSQSRNQSRQSSVKTETTFQVNGQAIADDFSGQLQVPREDAAPEAANPVYQVPASVYKSPENPPRPNERYENLPVHEAVDFRKNVIDHQTAQGDREATGHQEFSSLTSYGTPALSYHITERFVASPSDVSQVIVERDSVKIGDGPGIADRRDDGVVPKEGSEGQKADSEGAEDGSKTRKRNLTEKHAEEVFERQAPTEDREKSLVFRSETDLIPDVREGRHFEGARVSNGYAKVQYNLASEEIS